MRLLDWLIVLAYIVVALGIGLYLHKRGSKSMEDFFVSGRSLPWWLAGTGMAAAAFSIDTPLYVAGVVARQGIAGNWQWWAFALSHVMLVYVFARLWRRAEVITDAELIEIRYGGAPAAFLRGFRAFLFAVPINVVAFGYAMLAAKKVFVTLGISQYVSWLGGGELGAVILITVLTLAYASAAGLWGVVAADFFQFFLALFGAILVAIIATVHVGGISKLKMDLISANYGDRLQFFPIHGAGEIALTTFLAYIGIQWWAFRRSDGGGEFIQRLIASKNEREAEKAAWLFNILHYVVRTWPWIIVGLAALVLYPDTLAKGGDPEVGYLRLILDYLPTGLLGLVVASLLAAFMSVASVHINWGSSYIANDLYKRFARPGASQRELVTVGRVSSVVLAALAAWVAYNATDIAAIFTFMIAIGTGPGAVLILRWFWWRVNAWAEISSMIAGLLIALFLYTPKAPWDAFRGLASLAQPIADKGPAGVLTVTAFGTAVVWIIVMFLTPAESDETLRNFYRRVRPGGPGWKPQREQTGLAPLQDLGNDLKCTVMGIFFVFGSMFAIGGLVLLDWMSFFIALAVAIVSGLILLVLRRREHLARADRVI